MAKKRGKIMEKSPNTGEKSKRIFAIFFEFPRFVDKSENAKNRKKNLTLFCKKNYKKIGKNPKKFSEHSKNILKIIPTGKSQNHTTLHTQHHKKLTIFKKC